MTLQRPILRLQLQRCLAVAAASAAMLIGSGALGRDEKRPAEMAVTDAIESCVGSPPIRFRDGDKRVLLESVDSDAIAAAIVARYPMVEQDGNTPQGLVLWQQPKYSWVYVALLVDTAKPGEVCFTGSFEAAKFEMTAGLIDKYFGSGGAKK
jgi:hypothetical protein